MIIAATVNVTNVSGAKSVPAISGAMSVPTIAGEAGTGVITGTVNVTGISANIGSGITAPTASRWKFNKTPIPATDGSQVIFTLPNGDGYVSGKLRVYVDGLRQIKNTDYTETSGTTFTMAIVLDADEALQVDYLATE